MAAPPVQPNPSSAPVVPNARACRASFAASDTEVADRIRELVTKKQLERIAPRKNERDAIEAAYQKNRFMPLWFANGQPSERARAAMAHLRSVDADGLDPADYAMELRATSVEGAADAELKFTATVLTYARHAMNGRVHFSRVSPSIDYKDNFDAADAMNKVASSTDLKRTLDSFEPQHPGYKALKAKYAEMRPLTPAPRARRRASAQIRPRQEGRETFRLDRVPQLRERAAPPRRQRYDRWSTPWRVPEGERPTANGPDRRDIGRAQRSSREQQWPPWSLRWNAGAGCRATGATHVALNIPDFHSGDPRRPGLKTCVAVGKPTQATPFSLRR